MDSNKFPTPSTASIRREMPNFRIVKPLESSLKTICAEQRIPFVREKIEMIRTMVLELFFRVDISHYHHLINVGRLGEFIMRNLDFRVTLAELSSGKYKDDPIKIGEIDTILGHDFQFDFPNALELHDIGKLDPEVQKVINLKRKPSSEESDTIESHTAVKKYLEELGILKNDLIRIIATLHHFPEYAGTDPRLENSFHIQDTELSLDKDLYLNKIPLIVTMAKSIDIIEAMVSQIRPYKDPGPIRWYNHQDTEEYMRGGYLHTSIEGELIKKCPENLALSMTILGIVYAHWEVSTSGPPLKELLVTTRAQLRKRGEERAFDTLIEKHTPTTAPQKDREGHYSDRLQVQP